MSVAGGSDSSSNHFPTNGRKRRLSPHTNSKNDNHKTLNCPPDKRLCSSNSPSSSTAHFFNSHPTPLLDSEEQCSTTMASPLDSTKASNNRLPHSNNFAAKDAGLNDHARKSGQGKKLVIKNRKG